MGECTFCAELTGEETNNLLRIVLGEGYTTRVVRETENFVVLPTIGQIVEGYLLIVSKQHYLSFGHIPAQCFREFMNLKEETRQVLSEVYTSPIFFEHGPISESKRGGCCVEHAHLHGVPARIDLLDKLQTDFHWRSISSMLALRQQIERGMPYLFYESRDRRMYVFDAPLVPSQYLRQLVATRLGLEERWDWRLWWGVPEMISTLQTLKFWRPCG